MRLESGFRHGEVVFHNPVFVEGIDEGLEFARFGGFYEIGFCAHAIGDIDVLLAGGAGQDDDEEVLKVGLRAQPGEKLQAIESRHVKIDEEHAWGGGCFAVGVFADTQKIRHGLDAVADHLQRAIQTRFAKSVLQQLHVKIRIFN